MSDIHDVNLATFDLNLLRVLDALFIEQSVGRPAARLRLSQPATSNALARLREALGDPLFVRSRQGMVPTARARALRGPLTLALRQVQEALTPPEDFVPETAHRTFVLAASDHAQLIVLPQLAAQLAALPRREIARGAAPPRLPHPRVGVRRARPGPRRLRPRPGGPRATRAPATGAGARALHARGTASAIRPCASRSVFHLSLPQLHVSPRGGTESGFERKTKLRRNVVLFTPHYLVAPGCWRAPTSSPRYQSGWRAASPRPSPSPWCRWSSRTSHCACSNSGIRIGSRTPRTAGSVSRYSPPRARHPWGIEATRSGRTPAGRCRPRGAMW